MSTEDSKTGQAPSQHDHQGLRHTGRSKLVAIQNVKDFFSIDGGSGVLFASEMVIEIFYLHNLVEHTGLSQALYNSVYADKTASTSC